MDFDFEILILEGLCLWQRPLINLGDNVHLPLHINYFIQRHYHYFITILGTLYLFNYNIHPRTLWQGT